MCFPSTNFISVSLYTEMGQAVFQEDSSYLLFCCLPSSPLFLSGTRNISNSGKAIICSPHGKSFAGILRRHVIRQRWKRAEAAVGLRIKVQHHTLRPHGPSALLARTGGTKFNPSAAPASVHQSPSPTLIGILQDGLSYKTS